jgi:hypothetical protein
MQSSRPQTAPIPEITERSQTVKAVHPWPAAQKTAVCLTPGKNGGNEPIPMTAACQAVHLSTTNPIR